MLINLRQLGQRIDFLDDINGLVKYPEGHVSPCAALHGIPPRPSPGQACGVLKYTPHSSVFVRLAPGAFYEAVYSR
jgi:hypothetical protein